MRCQIALRVEYFDELIERQILVGLRRQGRRAYLCQQLGHARVARQIQPQCLSVDEEADQRFQLFMGAVGHRGSDHHLILS